jgi:hypothetical protein
MRLFRPQAALARPLDYRDLHGRRRLEGGSRRGGNGVLGLGHRVDELGEPTGDQRDRRQCGRPGPCSVLQCER